MRDLDNIEVVDKADFIKEYKPNKDEIDKTVAIYHIDGVIDLMQVGDLTIDLFDDLMVTCESIEVLRDRFNVLAESVKDKLVSNSYRHYRYNLDHNNYWLLNKERYDNRLILASYESFTDTIDSIVENIERDIRRYTRLDAIKLVNECIDVRDYYYALLDVYENGELSLV